MGKVHRGSLVHLNPFLLYLHYTFIMDIEFESGAAPDSRPRVKVSMEESKKNKTLIE